MLAFIIVGLVTGSLYGISGVGLVLTYRTTGVFNFANGAVAAAAAYLFFFLHDEHGVDWPLAAVISLGVVGVVGGLILEQVLRPLYHRSVAMAIVATVGLSIALQGYLYIQFGDALQVVPSFLPQSGFTVAGVSITVDNIITFALPALLTIGLYFYLRSSRLGVTMRGVVNSPSLVSLTGANPDRARRVAWVVGSAFAALSGILLVPTVGLDANMLSLTIISAFGAVAIGLFKSLPLTYLGGLGIGVVASIMTKYFTGASVSAIPGSVPFVVLIIVVLVVPARRFALSLGGSTRTATRQALPSILAKYTRRQVDAGRRALYGVGAIVVLLVPFFAGYRLPLFINTLIFVLVFASLSLLVNDSGQISLCQGVFVAVGASTFSLLTIAHGLPWLVALPLAGLVAIPVGLLVALPTVRLPGLLLALATFGFAVLVENVFYPDSFMFGSDLLISARRPVLGFITGSGRSFYYVVLAVVVVSMVAINAVRTGRSGRFLSGLAEAPVMLTTNGLGVSTTRLIVFSVSAFFSGIAGALLISLDGTLNSTTFTATVSLTWLAVLAFGGRTFLWASIVPAIAMSLVPGYITVFGVNQQSLIFGLNALVMGIGLREALGAKAAGRRRQPSPPPGDVNVGMHSTLDAPVVA